jgi:hypothetical protein
VRLLLAVVVLLILGLLAESIFDSAIGAWIAVGSLVAIVAIRQPGFGFAAGAAKAPRR